VVNPIKLSRCRWEIVYFSKGRVITSGDMGWNLEEGGEGHRAGWSELTKYTSSNTSSVKQEVE